MKVIEVTDSLTIPEMIEEVMFTWCWGQLEHGEWNYRYTRRGGKRGNVQSASI